MRSPFLEKNTLQCRLKAAQAEIAAFKSGKKYQDMQEMHRKEVGSLECMIRQLKEALAQAHKDLKANTDHWFEVFEDLKKEHMKREDALMKQMGQMEKRAFRAEGERDEGMCGWKNICIPISFSCMTPGCPPPITKLKGFF